MSTSTTITRWIETGDNATRVRYIGTALEGTIQRVAGVGPRGIIVDVEWDNGTSTRVRHEDTADA